MVANLVHTMLLLVTCSTLFCLTYSMPADVSRTESGTAVFKTEENRPLMKECRKFEDKVLRRTCRSMAANPLFYMDSPLPDEASPRQASEDEDSSIATELLMYRKTQDRDSCLSSAKNGKQKRHLSISPWDYHDDYDELRFPAIISFARCLCNGCIDITGRENRNFHSQLLTVDVSVIMRKSRRIPFTKCNSATCEIKKIPVAVGCHCIRPRFIR